jgi:hypothetical protein
MSTFPQITESELARARTDAAFRQKLLTQSLEVLLARMQKLRASALAGGEGQIREGVELAVRLAELIQEADRRADR